MTESALAEQVTEAEETIRTLREELDKTNSGLVALALELEQRVDERTADVRAAQETLRQANADLERRVAERTSELEAMNDQMASMSQQLWQTAKLATMGELAASIAHELNNPLGTVTLRIESILAQLPESDPQREALEVVEGEVDRMANLVANLLQFGRRSQQQISSIDVRTEIAATLDLMRSLLRNRSVTVVRDFAEDIPLVPADRQLLRQLFLNLVTNAADAMPNGGKLTIRVASSAGRVVMEFADTGIGIAPEVLARVKEPFFTTKPEGKGTGLGIPICQRIVQDHRGSFDIASQLGVGTTVRVELPLANGQSAALRAGGLDEAG